MAESVRLEPNKAGNEVFLEVELEVQNGDFQPSKEIHPMNIKKRKCEENNIMVELI